MNKKTISLLIATTVIIAVMFVCYFYQKQKSQEAIVSPEQNEIPFLFGENKEQIISGTGWQKVPPAEEESVPEGLFE